MPTTLHLRNVKTRSIKRKVSFLKRIEGRATSGGNSAKNIRMTSIRNEASNLQKKVLLGYQASWFPTTVVHGNDTHDQPEAVWLSRSPPSSWSPPASSSFDIARLTNSKCSHAKQVNSDNLLDTTATDTLKFTFDEYERTTPQTL